MKVWEKTKEFCKKHKTAVVSSLVGAATFITGWIVKRNIDNAIVNEMMERLPYEIDKDLKDRYEENASLSLVTDESLKRFEDEQEELRGKYGQDFAILEEATKNLTEPEKGKLWLIENGVVSLVDGIEYNEEADES